MPTWSLEVPWANTDVVLEPSAPHDSQEYWSSVGGLFAGLYTQLEGKDCEWREFPQLLGIMSEMREEYALRKEMVPVLGLMSERNRRNCAESR